jgi:glycosyltransferase involved in cell wall biosynthesis
LLFYTCITNFKKHKPKLIICYGVLNFLGSYLSSLLLRTKLILSLHNSTDVEKIKKFPFLKKLVNSCDDVWVCSYELYNQVKHEFGIEPFYRPTGFDPEEFYPLDDTNRLFKMKLISVGSFKWKKNFKTLIAAFKLLSEKLPNLSLSIIGGGELESNLRHQAAELGVSEKVKFLGILSQDKIASELNNSSLFVLPSMAEGRPKVVAEALATGLPCVVSEACSCNDIVKGAGISLKRVSSHSIFDAVMKIMSNPADWKNLSNRAQLNIKSSSWKEISYLEQQHIINIINRTN